ncbi:DUF4398 domain-containing protein [Chitinimonas naiadis]
MRTRQLTGWPGATLTTFAAFALNGCSYTPMPRAQMAMAEIAVQHANTPDTIAHAANELHVAMDKVGNARQALNSQDYLRAGQLAEQAVLDARLAELRARSATRQNAYLPDQGKLQKAGYRTPQ